MIDAEELPPRAVTRYASSFSRFLRFFAADAIFSLATPVFLMFLPGFQFAAYAALMIMLMPCLRCCRFRVFFPVFAIAIAC